ncbi:(2Fe-2S)-binding protein [Streptomyces seoulensis]
MSTGNICVCYQVTEDELVGWIRRGVTTVEGLGEHSGAGQGCGDCHEMLEELIEDFAEGGPGNDTSLAVSRALG